MLKFPADDIGPLVKAQGKISVGVNPFAEAGIHNCLRGRSDGNWLLEIGLA